jgi:hypothetical protein
MPDPDLLRCKNSKAGYRYPRRSLRIIYAMEMRENRGGSRQSLQKHRRPNAAQDKGRPRNGREFRRVMTLPAQPF